VNEDGSYGHVRRIIIGAEDYKSRSKSGSKHSMESDQSDDLELPDHNLSSSLVLKSLKDGNFSAGISLRDLPPGDLTVYVRGHKLDFFMERRHSCPDIKHRITIPLHYGVVDLPIFVDENSLTFAQDPQKDVLFIHGRTKGYFSRRRSLSQSMIHPSKEGSFWKTIRKKFGFKQTRGLDSIVRSISMDSSLDGNHDQLW
jgi:hypothetical protein